MDKKLTFYWLVGIIAVAGMYLASIGGFHLSPQKVRVSPGEIRTVANGRARIVVGQISYHVPLEIRCGKEVFSVDTYLEEEPSEKYCGIRVRTHDILEGRFGTPSAVLEIQWD